MQLPLAPIGVITAISVALIQPANAPLQQQQAGARANWPCGARVDPSYFDIAEGTGGHLFLLAPFEIADSAPLLLALDEHPATIFRLAGSITPGDHEFSVPVDSAIESLLFSISVQCLQRAEVFRPSGTAVSGEGVSDYSNFRAERMVIVKQPEAGTWKIRAGGSGIAGVMVQARGGVGLSVEFAPARDAKDGGTPIANVENVVRVHVSGDVQDVHASIVSGAFRTIARLPLAAGDEPGTFVSRFTPGVDGFRIAVAGTDAQGQPFQRVDARLFTAR